MEYRKVGRSGLRISELSLGSWLTFGAQRISRTPGGHAQSIQGINFFDNAGPTRAECLNR